MAAEQPSQFYAEILGRLARVRGKRNRLSLLYGSLVTILVALALVLVVIVLEEIFSFNVLGRTLLMVASSAGIAASLVWFVIRPLLRSLGILKSDDNTSL